MAKIDELKKDIEALKKAINNPNNTNPQAKASMQGVLDKLEAQVKSLASSSPAGKTYEKELARQKDTGEAKGEGISLYAMSKALENKPKPATLSSKEPIKKRAVPVPKADQDKPDYDCDDLIEKAEARRIKAKERANAPQKTEATKNKEKLDKVFDNVKERAEDDDITKAEIQKLIDSTESLLTLLKKKLATL